jgi:hypothetical protein
MSNETPSTMDRTFAAHPSGWSMCFLIWLIKLRFNLCTEASLSRAADTHTRPPPQRDRALFLALHRYWKYANPMCELLREGASEP